MASGWGDDIDEELQKNEKITVGFQFNYMGMSHLIQRIESETREWDDKYPKTELMTIWGYNLFWMQVLFLLSYNVVLVFTIPFLGFYFHVLIQISQAYKRFSYKRTGYWLLTVAVLVAEIAFSFLVRHFLGFE